MRLAISYVASLRTGISRRVVASLAVALVALCQAASASAFDAFTVKDIRVEGVQRTEAGTIFSYLPIKVGERIDDEKAAQAIKAPTALKLLESEAAIAVGSTPAEFAKFIEAEQQRWKPVIARAKIKPE